MHMWEIRQTKRVLTQVKYNKATLLTLSTLILRFHHSMELFGLVLWEVDWELLNFPFVTTSPPVRTRRNLSAAKRTLPATAMMKLG